MRFHFTCDSLRLHTFTDFLFFTLRSHSYKKNVGQFRRSFPIYPISKFVIRNHFLLQFSSSSENTLFRRRLPLADKFFPCAFQRPAWLSESSGMQCAADGGVDRFSIRFSFVARHHFLDQHPFVFHYRFQLKLRNYSLNRFIQLCFAHLRGQIGFDNFNFTLRFRDQIRAAGRRLRQRVLCLLQFFLNIGQLFFFA